MADSNKSGDLMSSGKVVAEAAVSVVQKHSVENVDKEKVATASADILHAASTYGHLEDKPVGQYIGKAEGYLSQFGSAAPAAAADAKKEAEATKEGTGDGAGAESDAPKAPEAKASKEPAPPAAKDDKPEGFSLGDAVKGAGGLLEKKGDEEGAGAGAGGLFKIAQGFLK